jgi:hypothetical protein
VTVIVLPSLLVNVPDAPEENSDVAIFVLVAVAIVSSSMTSVSFAKVTLASRIFAVVTASDAILAAVTALPPILASVTASAAILAVLTARSAILPTVIPKSRTTIAPPTTSVEALSTELVGSNVDNAVMLLILLLLPF